MFTALSEVALAISAKATLGISELLFGSENFETAPTITPRCDFVNALRGVNGQDKFQQFIENFYGFVLTYLPWIVVGLVLALAIVVGFAVRRRVIPAVISTVIALLFLGSIVSAVTNIGSVGPCPGG